MAGDDVPLITSIIASASVCVDCIARETKLKPAQADTALRVIVQSLTVSAHAGRCERCQKLTVVYRLR